MYTEKNYKTKKQLREAVARGDVVRLQPPHIGQPVTNGTADVEGPHYPEAHKWYASVTVREGRVVSVR